MSKVKFGVFIGRFQVPSLHSGHRMALGVAASQSETLIILVGSANVCPSIKNPWDIDFRINSVRCAMHSMGYDNFVVLPVNDYLYNDSQWMNDVRDTVKHIAGDEKVTLFGSMKEGNDYLTWFPGWKFRDIPSDHLVNATMIRNQLFQAASAVIPPNMMADYAYYQQEKAKFADYPFPETLNFSCGDALLECAGHVLLIQRLRAPGKDTWALPGGFKNNNETHFDAAIRELFEETGVKVPEIIIRRNVVTTRLFDDPRRSTGIPRNTLAVHIKIDLNSDGTLPKVKPADDAAEVEFFPIETILNDMVLFDDHSQIISVMTGVLPKPAYLKYTNSI